MNASFRRRLATACIDMVLGLTVGVGLTFALTSSASALTAPDDWYVTEWWLKVWLDSPAHIYAPLLICSLTTIVLIVIAEHIFKTSLGGKVFGLALVDSHGAEIDRGRLIIRQLAAALNVASLGLGFLWIIISPARKSWPDSLSGSQPSRVVRS